MSQTILKEICQKIVHVYGLIYRLKSLLRSDLSNLLLLMASNVMTATDDSPHAPAATEIRNIDQIYMS